MSVKLCLPQVGQGILMLCHESGHLFLAEGVDGLGQLEAVLFTPLLNELVSAEAFLTFLAVHEGVREAAQMAGSDPGLGVHEDGGVQTHVVGVLLDELLPPSLLDVVLQLHTQRAVVPGVGQAAVNFAAREDEATAFAQGNDLIHGFLLVIHNRFSFFYRRWLCDRCCSQVTAAGIDSMLPARGQ